MVERSGWTLNRLVALVVLGGFAMILVEVRYLHDEVLGHHTVAWAPIVYSGLMTASVVLVLFFWERGGRRVLFWAFAASLAVAPIGFWFHNEGRPWRGLRRELLALARPVGHARSEGEHAEATQGHGEPGSERRSGAGPGAAESGREDVPGHRRDSHEEEGGGPPPLAPLSIAGLGTLGLLACARRYQPPSRLGS